MNRGEVYQSQDSPYIDNTAFHDFVAPPLTPLVKIASQILF